MKKQDYIDLAEYLRSGQFDKQNKNSIFYRGFGQLNALLYDPDKANEWPGDLVSTRPVISNIYQHIFKKYNGSSKRIISGLKQASISSYFTPLPICKAVTDAINFSKINKILDPSAGTGNFLNYLPSNKAVTALEPDLLSFEILQSLYPQANAINQQFQEAKLDKYDLIISNIPFGAIKVFDHKFYDSRDSNKISATTRIHNYFFVKALDHLIEDGLLVFITSSAFADSASNQPIREYLMKRSTLTAMVRLPGDVFKDAGTKPTTDLIVLQKRQNNKLSVDDKLFINARAIEIENKQVYCNDFLGKNHHYILGDFHAKGQYGNDQFTVSSKETIHEIGKKLQVILSRQIDNVKHQPTQSNFQRDDLINASKKAIDKYQIRLTKDHIGDWFEEGNLYVYDNKVYIIKKDSKGHFIDKPLKTVKNIDQVVRILNIRITYKLLIKGEQNKSQTVEKIRKNLNDHYDLFTYTYGSLNHINNAKVIKLDIDSHKILSLENSTGNTFTKSDIFQQSTIINQNEVQIKPTNLNDAILCSLNTFNEIDLEYISKLLSKPESEVFSQAVEEDLLYLDYNNSKWRPVTRDKFISGNILQKIEHVQTCFPKQYEQLKEKHIDILTQHQTTIIPYELIDINLGERWIDNQLYEDFLSDFFEVKVSLNYLISKDKFQISFDKPSSISTINYSVRGVSTLTKGKSLMEHAFADTTPSITYTVPEPDGTPRTLKDTKAIRNAVEKIKIFNQKFDTWLNASDKWKNIIEKKYNRIFNNISPRVYDGSHLTLEGLSHYTPYSTQKNAVYRNLQNNGGINDHKVGAGKTLVMAISAYEMKRLAIAIKPLIIAKNANVSAIYQEYMLAYPEAKILHPYPKDFKPENRRLLFQRIVNNNWDCVIISHEQFKMIPQSRAIQIDIIQKEIDALESDLETMNTIERSVSTVKQKKGLEKRKENMLVNLNELEASIIRDPHIVDFEKMGFDHLFVDESQEFKNLLYTTRHTQVSGLGSPKGSQRAFNLLLACRTIQRKLGNVDKGITFLSGTTISNSLVEMYLLFKYLRPHALEELEIRSFDSWAKVYARKSYDYEFSITNELKQKERYREFIKVPELACFYTEIADVVNDKNFHVDKPKIKNHIIELKPTSSQIEYMNNLINFAKTQNGCYIDKPNMSENEQKAYMLIATNLAKKMSLDMRLINADYEFEKGSKLDSCTYNVAKTYHESRNYKGTQIIFCDQSTPSKSKWNIYDAIKDRLINTYNIPSKEIAFIHDAKSTNQKKTMYEQMNQGIIRILIGSTTKLGVGVNVQKAIVALHHLDIPWRPSDMEQRNGRAGRPGNLMAKLHNNNIVDNYIYAVERSLDSYQFNILANKQKFIDQIKDNTIKARRIDEGSMRGEGNEQQMNFAEYVARLSGNTNLLDLVKVNKQLKDIEIQYDNFYTDKIRAKSSIKFCEDTLKKKKDLIEKLETDRHIRNAFEQPADLINKAEERYYYPKPVVINEKPYYDIKSIGVLISVAQNNSTENLYNDALIATYGSFLLMKNYISKSIYLKGPSGIKYTYANGYPSHISTLIGSYIKSCLDKQENLINNAKSAMDKLLEEIPSHKIILNQTFNKKDEIITLKKEKKRLTDLIEEESKTSEKVSENEDIEESINNISA